MALPIPRAMWPLVVTAGVNDKLDFRVSPTTYAATVAAGTYYTPQALLDAVVAAVYAQLSSSFPWYSIAWPVGLNLLAAPEDLTSGSWTKSSCTITPNINLAPDGQATIDRITDTAFTGTHYVTQTVAGLVDGDSATSHAIVGAGTKTWCLLMVGEGSAYFNLAGAGAVGTVSSGVTASIVPLGAGWFRILVSKILTAADVNKRFAFGPANGNGLFSYAGDGTGTIQVGWCKLEKSAVFSGYQPQSMAAAQPAGRVTLMRGAATLEFLFGSGANKATSIHPYLGFADVDRAAAIVHTSDHQHRNGWYGIDPVQSDTRDLPEYDRRQGVAKSGAVRGLEVAKRKTRAVELAFLPGSKVYVADEGSAAVNEAVERLFDDGWGRFRWWPDGLVAGTYGDYALDVETAKALPYRRLNAANALYSLALRMRSFV